MMNTNLPPDRSSPSMYSSFQEKWRTFLRSLKRLFFLLIFLSILSGLMIFFIDWYSFIFSRKVTGVVVGIERVQLNVSLLQQVPSMDGIGSRGGGLNGGDGSGVVGGGGLLSWFRRLNPLASGGGGRGGLGAPGAPSYPSQLYSFAVAIQEITGEIVTASAEDRQWAVVQKGQCAEARFYPYPPWNVTKAGTYFNARLDKLFECPSSLRNHHLDRNGDQQGSDVRDGGPRSEDHRGGEGDKDKGEGKSIQNGEGGRSDSGQSPNN